MLYYCAMPCDLYFYSAEGKSSEIFPFFLRILHLKSGRHRWELGHSLSMHFIKKQMLQAALLTSICRHQRAFLSPDRDILWSYAKTFVQVEAQSHLVILETTPLQWVPFPLWMKFDEMLLCSLAFNPSSEGLFPFYVQTCFDSFSASPSPPRVHLILH